MTNLRKLKVMTVFGGRPEAIKMAPLVLELQRHSEQIDHVLTVTAQHREMLDTVLGAFNLTPDYDLDVMTHGQSLEQLTVRIIEGLEPILRKEKPDLLLVHGDTSTTFLASYTAFLQKIPVGHVEAGLRTWNKLSPYPEEANRQLTGVLADYHFAPTPLAEQNLLAERKHPDNIFVTGNTVTDVFAYTVRENLKPPLVEWAADRKLILMTAHRREAIGEGHQNIFSAVRRLAAERSDIAIVYPVHPNPAVREPAHQMLGELDNVKLIEPVDVFALHQLYPYLYMILTDSGGLQEEAPSFGVPVLVLRDTTERPEGIEAGVLKLVGTDEAVVYENASKLLDDPAAHVAMRRTVNPYGDGKASERIVQAIKKIYGLSDTSPQRFEP